MANQAGLEKINGNFKGKDILDANQFSKKDIDIVLKTAERMKKIVLEKGGTDILKGKIMTAMFFEPSSRTFGSFVAAMQRLGGGFIPLQGMGNTSAGKGESFEDTVQTFTSYSDVIVIRHPEVGSVAKAAEVTSLPVINAGDGIGEHPTQALYDLFTIKDELGRLENLHLAFFGELARYRPVNSLAKLLAVYPKIKLSFISPPQVTMNPKTREYLRERKVPIFESDKIEDILPEIDVLYVTRVKKEFMSEELYKKIQGKYIVDMKLVNKMKRKSVIMHPLPRIGEITTEVDADPRAVYLRSQMRNGLYVRMALLALVLGKIK